MSDTQKVMDMIKEHDVKYVDFRFTDPRGKWQHLAHHVRTISEDWVVRYENRFFQLEPQSRHYAPAKAQVRVCEGREGRLTIEYRGHALRWQEIPPPLRPRSEETTRSQQPRVAQGRREKKQKWVPPADHPWRVAAGRAVEKKVQGEIPVSPSLALPCASP